MLKLGYLFTFITALTNVFGITNINWWIVLTPSVGVTVMLILLILVVALCTYISNTD